MPFIGRIIIKSELNIVLVNHARVHSWIDVGLLVGACLKRQCTISFKGPLSILTCQIKKTGISSQVYFNFIHPHLKLVLLVITLYHPFQSQCSFGNV